METLIEMNRALAIATFVLAAAAVFSIFANRCAEKRAMKRSFLDNIIKWALDITNVISGVNINIPTEVATKEQKEEIVKAINLSNRINFLNRYKALRDESESIETLVSTFKNKDFDKLIKQTKTALKKHIDVLGKEVGHPSEREALEDNAYANTKRKLDNSAMRLAKSARNMQTDLIRRIL